MSKSTAIFYFEPNEKVLTLVYVFVTAITMQSRIALKTICSVNESQ